MTKLHPPTATVADYRPDIDGLRGIAVLLVVAFHAAPAWFPGGFIGVDVFFVISGYLITKIILEQISTQSFSLTQFYSRRIRRILPALILVVATIYLAGAFLLLRDEFQHLSQHTLAAAGFASNFLLWSESGYFDAAAEIKPLLHLWSLSIEEQFYILWPALILVAAKFRLRLGLLTGALIIGSLSWGIFAISRDPVAAFYSPQTRVWELLIGAFLATLASNKAAQKISGIESKMGSQLFNYGALLGISLIVAATILLNSKSAFPGALALAPVLGAALLICGQAAKSWVNRELLTARALVWFGKISFPLYLWHWPLLSYARILENQTPPLPIRIGLVCISILLAWATYKWIETPIRYGPRQKSKTIALILLLLALGATAYWNVRSGPPSAVVVAHTSSPLSTQPSSAPPTAATTPTVSPLTTDAKLPLTPTPQAPEAPQGQPKIAPQVAPQVAPTTPATANPARVHDDRLSKYEQRIADNPDYITDLAASRQKSIRANQCHLHKYAQPFEQYAQGLNQCLYIEPGKQNILILGDSHAADLYAALASTQSRTNYLQATGAGCTPMKALHTDQNDGCARLYDYAMRVLRDHKVDAVILAARWPANFAEIERDIIALKTLSAGVVLVGPAHEYKEDAHKLLARRNKAMHYDEYLRTFLDEEKFALNKKMADFATKQKVKYIDRIAAYCGAEINCPVLSPTGELYASPAGHLNVAGQQYLGARLNTSNATAPTVRPKGLSDLKDRSEK